MICRGIHSSIPTPTDSSSTGRTRSRRRSPAAVGAIDRVVCSTRRTPSRSSRLRTISLTRGGELGPAAGAEGPGRTVSTWQSRRRFLKAASESFCCSILGRLAASYRWRHSWQHAIESHAATNGGFIPGGRRSGVLSRSHSGRLDIRTAVRRGRERRRKIVVATRAAERPFQRAQAIGRRGAGPALCGYPP